MENQEVIEGEDTIESTNKFEIPESFREKYSENPDLAIEQLYKAQHKIVEQKKAEKVEKKVIAPSEGLTEEQFYRLTKEQEFFKENPEMLEHKDNIRKLTSNGISLNIAAKQIMEDNPDIVARQTTKQSNFTSGTPDFSKTEYSRAELEAMNQTSYNKVMDLKEQGKVRII